MRRVALTVNGVRHDLEVEPRELLVYVLRDRLGLTGTNVGCDTSSCGACTVLVNGESVKSCTMLGVQADGVEITTIEGPRDERRAPSGPAGVPRPPRAPVRLLHAGDGPGGGQPHRERRRDRRGGDSRGPRREPLPLHRVPQHRRGCRVRGGGGVMTAIETAPGFVGTSVKRKEDASLLRGRGTFIDNLTLPGDRVHGRRAQPVPARPDHEREPRRRASGRGCRRRVQRRRPRRRLEGRAPVRLAGHRGHQDAVALPARDRRGSVPGRRRRGRHRGEPCAREGCGRARRGRLRAAPVDRGRREGARGRRAARALRLRDERVLRLEARDGRRAGGDRRCRRRRHAPLLPAAPDPQRDRAARRARAGRSDGRGDALVGDAGAAHPALRAAARARHPRVEDPRDRSRRGRRLRLEAQRLRRGGARRCPRQAAGPAREVDRGARRELRGDDPRPRRRPRADVRSDEGRHDHGRQVRGQVRDGRVPPARHAGHPAARGVDLLGPVRDPELQRDVHRASSRTRRRPTRIAVRAGPRRRTSSSGRWTRSPASSAWTRSSCGGRTS